MLYSCAIYVSSGTVSVARRVAAAAKSAQARVAVVDTFTDAAYARSSVKLVGEAEALVASARAAVTAAVSLVDLTTQPHPAAHPRQGAADMVSFMPLTGASVASSRHQLAACDAAAWRLGEALGLDAVVPVLMYGTRACRSVLETRRATSFFSSVKSDASANVTTSLTPDFGNELVRDGIVPQRSGIAIIGAQPYVTNFNVQVRGASLKACQAVAKELRSAMGVQVMALPHESSGSVEIACNLQATETIDCHRTDDVLMFIANHIPAEASIDTSYVIGLTPQEALAQAGRFLGA